MPYLQDVPLDEARARFDEALRGVGALAPGPAVSVPLEAAVGRVTASAVWARTSNPHYHAAAMDGVAVAAATTLGASPTSPLRLGVGRDAVWVDTGDAIPPGMDAVVMLEDLHEVGDGSVEILAAVVPWQHVRPLGEDIVATELVLPAGHTLRPVDVAAAAAAGHATLEIRQPPRVAVLPTGSELVPPGAAAGPGQIVDSNSLMLAATAREWGADAERLPPLPDDFGRLRAAVDQALDRADIVVINAGSSAGAEDFTARVTADLGEVLVHGVAIRPGHPVVLGVARGRAVVGIPGYPVSAALALELFVAPLIDARLGRRRGRRPTLRAVVPRAVVSPMGDDEFVRVKIGRVGERTIAAPLARGAGMITSMVRADGIVRIPRMSEGLAAGSSVDVDLLADPEAVNHTTVIIGSHDPALDLLANDVHRRFAPAAVASTNVGSQGGLVALRRNNAHAAGCHLIDPATGAYNVADVQRILPGREVVLVTFAHRQQGLMVAPGNPRRIQAIDDLLRDDVVFVNRQRGSGTRMLLDYELQRRGIAGAAIAGYDRELYTHVAVAAEVAAGGADAGLGVLAAARALKLDFIPLLEERYDLAIPHEHYESPVLRPVLEVLHDPEFARQVEAMGGYDAARMGQIAAELPGPSAPEARR